MIDPLSFGRPRNDRGPLLIGAGVAVLLHVLAIFIPLPELPMPDAPPPPPEPTGIIWISPTPPDLPDPPPPFEPAALTRRLPVPWDEPQDPGPVEEPDLSSEAPLEAAEGLTELSLGVLDPPPAVGIVDELTAGLVPPVCIHKPDPEFPHAGTWIRQSGSVVLQAVIDREGNVTDIELIDVTDPDLGYSRSAIEAVGRWRYRPGTLHGRPVAVRLTVQVEFTVN